MLIANEHCPFSHQTLCFIWIILNPEFRLKLAFHNQNLGIADEARLKKKLLLACMQGIVYMWHADVTWRTACF